METRIGHGFVIVGGKPRALPLLMLRSLTVFESSAAVTPISTDFSAHGVPFSKSGRRPVEGVAGLAKAAPPISDATTDEELGQALIEQHPDALPVAWRRYYPMISKMLRRALGAGRDTEDVVQDVFLCLFRRAPALRDASAVRPFIIGIVRHTLHRERRRRLRRRQLASEYGPLLADRSVGGGAAAGYAVIKLSDLLLRLTEQERTSFVLRFGHGMTVPEVAEELRVSEPTAKRRLSRARECLGAWAADDPFLLGYLRGKNAGLNSAVDC
jgi:RNA polymerase sigma factor (sigma-70 family)